MNNKYIKMLLCGFALFVIGMLCINLELNKFSYVNYLPDDFDTFTSTTRLEIENDINYKVKRAANNQKIAIQKRVDDSLGNEIIIEEQYTNTSRIISRIVKDKNNTTIIYSNEFNLFNNDIPTIFNLVIRCLTERKIYNYNMLKYSKITIYGNEDVLSNIKVDGYGI